MSANIEAAGATRAGRRRSINQDALAVEPALHFYAVADGMSSLAAGEVASKLAIDAMREHLGDPESTWPPELDLARRDLANHLVAGVKRANLHVYRAWREARAPRMGATFAGVLAIDDRLCIAHVGDSRVYRFRDGRVSALTEDHTLLNEALWRGVPFDVAEAMPAAARLTRALGIGEALDVPATIAVAKPGDVVLLATNGVCGALPVTAIGEVLAELRDLDAGVEALLARAEHAGGSDDATAVLLRWSAGP